MKPMDIMMQKRPMEYDAGVIPANTAGVVSATAVPTMIQSQ